MGASHLNVLISQQIFNYRIFAEVKRILGSIQKAREITKATPRGMCFSSASDDKFDMGVLIYTFFSQTVLGGLWLFGIAKE